MSQRKLLQEIDKVFKKVKEGLEIFDGYYEKLQSCESQSQKEKLESDLKREIKKLQRQRDQIKNWLGGNEVKDKKQLLENRKLIENAMERFKVVEKNMKTKAFSKEGLSMQRIDPREKEKNETSDFIHQMLEELERQCEKHEATVDRIQSSSKKGKKLELSKQNEISELQEKIARNHWHEEKLEQILRLLANDDLECEDVNNLQEDIKYFVESNEDADFIEDETIYDELGLEDVEETYGNIGDFPQSNNDDENPEAPLSSNNTPKKPSVGSFQPPTSAGSQVQTPSVNASQSNVTPTAATAIANSAIAATTAASVAAASIAATAPSTTTVSSSPASSKGPVARTDIPVTSSSSIGTTNLRPSIAPKPELKYASVLSAGVNSNHSTPSLSSAQLSTNNNINTISTPTTVAPPGLVNNTHTSSASPQQSLPTQFETNSKEAESSREATQSPIITPSVSNAFEELIENFEKVKQRINKPAPFETISKILETSLLNCPDSLDSERPRQYHPITPHPTSIHYPQEPLPELFYPSIIAKLDLSTLFFNFYYNQDVYSQILSAKELAKKGWSFDKLSKKWFQRSEEIQPPSLINDQIVNSEKKITWKYFDNEGVWLPRRKDDFDNDSVQLETSF